MIPAGPTLWVCDPCGSSGPHAIAILEFFQCFEQGPMLSFCTWPQKLRTRVGGTGLIPGRGAKVLHVVQINQQQKPISDLMIPLSTKPC